MAKCGCGALFALISTLFGSCPGTEQPQPVTAVVVTADTQGPVTSQDTVTFTVTFNQPVDGFSDPAEDVQINHEGTAGGNVTINAAAGTVFTVEVTGVTGDGSYTITVPEGAAQDELGNDSPAGTSPEVAVDNTPPVVTVANLATTNRQPELTGNVDDPEATVVITVDGGDYDATNNGDGTWTLPAGTLPVLDFTTYEVIAEATDEAGNAGLDNTVMELMILEGEGQG